MADAAVGFLLQNLKQLLLYNAELIGNSKGHIEGLLGDLSLFKAFLKASTKERSDDPILEAMVKDIRKVVEKAEDVIDKFVVQKSIFKSKGAWGKMAGAVDHAVNVRHVAVEIESIRKDVKEIYDRKQFAFQASPHDDRSAPEKKSPAVEEDNVVGFDGEAETVIQRLTAKELDLDIITIIGMPGLGKTTLAKKIYNDPVIEYEFFTRVWVDVSQKYSKRDIFLSILSTFTNTTNTNHSSDVTIGDEVRKCLEKGKYLIIVDDVWNKGAWDDIKSVFPNNNKGSRILITSRHKYVALHANPNKDPHSLKFLEDEESLELLVIKVFGKGKLLQGELDKRGKQIAKKCEGLPLAIVVIAGILISNRDSSDWWEQVAENVNHFVVRDEEQFMEVIALSYNHLSYILKSCFLYLGIFPKHYGIPVWKLIRLWIAEGFMEENEELSLEDVAESYVNELINRNLLMVVERRSNGEIKTCRVHDMLYDFCKTEAENQNLYREIKSSEQVTRDNYRRICIHSNVMDYISTKPTGERVRSFLCFFLKEITLPAKHISTIPKGFELLRVLDARYITFPNFPRELLKLALLRYVAISCNDVNTLPASISKLWNLQTLIFMTTSPTLALKEDVWKLYQLRHLHTNASAILPRPPSKTLLGKENVKSLSMISPESCTEDVFARTPHIKKLGVRGNLAILLGNSFENLGKLSYLTNLKLVNDVLSRPISEGKILGLPLAYKFPTKLKKLTLSKTFIDWEHLEILGNLEKLEVLKLKENAFDGSTWEPKDGGFRSLKVLHIKRSNLVTWNAKENQFPTLTRLVLEQCEKLEAVPSCLADVDSFQVLELSYANKAAADSAKDIQRAKNTKQAQDTITRGVFKLSIYPPEVIHLP